MANISTFGQTIDQISRLTVQQVRLDTLTEQLATGKKTQFFGDLSSEAIVSKRARADIRATESFINNIVNTQRRINLMLASIEDVKQQASSLLQSIASATQQGELPDLPAMQELAESVYEFSKDVINSKDNDRFLFAGADSSTRPITDTGLFTSFLGEFVPDSSDLTLPALVSSGVIGQWGDGTIDTDTFIQTYRGTDDTTLGYSPSLVNGTAGDVFVRVDEKSEFKYTVLGNTDGFRDVIIASNVLANLPPVEFAPGALNDPTATTLAGDTPPSPPAEKQENFFQVFNDLGAMLSNAIDELDRESFRIGLVQSNINTVQISHEQDINTLKTIVGEVEDADITEIATSISQIQVQLEASFRVSASIAELSLARFI